MISLLTFMAAIGSIGALALRYGTDSRHDDGPKL
jgi:hypothetical protein